MRTPRRRRGGGEEGDGEGGGGGRAAISGPRGRVIRNLDYHQKHDGQDGAANGSRIAHASAIRLRLPSLSDLPPLAILQTSHAMLPMTGSPPAHGGLWLLKDLLRGQV